MAKTLRKNSEKDQKFKVAYETRNLEINLFWIRYGAFWIIVAAAFVGFVELKSSKNIYSLLLASFGIISSLAWTLINRGSKYWQETWEDRAGQNDSTGFFRRWESLQKKNFWGAKRFSVSKLAIILSDYVLFCWILIFGVDGFYYYQKLYNKVTCFYTEQSYDKFLLWSTLVLTIISVIILFIGGKTTLRIIETHDDIQYRIDQKRGKYKLKISGTKFSDNFRNKYLIENKFLKKYSKKYSFIKDMIDKLPRDKEKI